MTDTRCGKCRHYAELKEPFHYEKDGYKEGVTVFGFCGKNVTKTFFLYPVYLPDGGVCKEFKGKKNIRSEADGTKAD